MKNRKILFCSYNFDQGKKAPFCIDIFFMKIKHVEKIQNRYLDTAYRNAYMLIDRSIQEGKEIVKKN